MKISLQDIEVGDLNNVSIMVISKFARALHEHDGTALKMNDPNVLLKIARYANSVDNAQLSILYQRLRLELKHQLNDAIPSHAQVGRLVMPGDLKTRVRNRLEVKRFDS